MKAKRWIVRGQDSETIASLARVLGVSPILAALLITRGCDDERTARAFLYPSYDFLNGLTACSDLFDKFGGHSHETKRLEWRSADAVDMQDLKIS